MVLLTEQIRHLNDEKVLIDVATAYARSACTWATLHDYGNIVLTVDSVIIVSYAVSNSNPMAGGGKTSAHRLKVGTMYVSGHQFDTVTNTTVEAMFFLAAGTYNVLMEAAGDYFDGNNYRLCTVSNFKMGSLTFPDTDSTALEVYAAHSHHLLVSRLTPIGTTKNGVMHINVMAYNAATAVALPTVDIDGVNQSWQTSKTIQVAGSYCNSYGSAWGKIATVCTLDADHIVTLTGGTGTMYVSIVFTPWILPVAVTELVNIDVPQGSTVYCTSEPLFLNPTKTIEIGKVRAISFGATTDYYYVSSGIDILSSSYTIEIVKVDSCFLNGLGYGGCISAIGVDIR
jgi:hypothetical protein